MDQFWPADSESFLSAPPPALESLRPVLDQCLMMKGISGVPIAPFNGAPHALELSTWLSAMLPDSSKRNQINIAISADQIAANFIGYLTSLPSLELATMPQTHKENQEGLNEGYYSHCSFRSATQAVPAETNPRSVLNRLFREAEAGASGPKRGADVLERSMLDLVIAAPGICGVRCLRTINTSWMNTSTAFVQSSAASPRLSIGKKKRRSKPPESASANATPPIPPPIEVKIPEGDKRSEYMQVMCDLNVLAFQTDTTRVSTYIGSTPNGVSYPELGFKDEHHSQTHHNNQPDKVDKVAKSPPSISLSLLT